MAAARSRASGEASKSKMAKSSVLKATCQCGEETASTRGKRVGEGEGRGLTESECPFELEDELHRVEKLH